MEFDSIESDQVLLDAALADFRMTMLASDTFFALAAAISGNPEPGLPDFACEPTFDPATGVLGVRLAQSGTPAVPGVTANFSQDRHHLEFGRVDWEVGRLTPSDTLRNALQKAGVEASEEALQSLIETWQQGWGQMRQRLSGGRFAIHPLTHTFTSVEEYDSGDFTG